jgi:peptidoglycan pentaglycine glycine transferase (the first glycine)
VELQMVGEDGREEYDRAVAAHPRADFLQAWGWGELKAFTGWRPWRFLVREGGSAVGALSVLERPVPGLGPLLYAPRGPVVDWSHRAAVDACLGGLVALARDRGAVAIKLDPAVPKDDPHCRAALLRHGFRPVSSGEGFEDVQPRFVMHLRLQGRSADELLAGMHPKTRYNIRLAERRGVEVRVGGRDDLPAFYALLLETARRDRFTVRSFPYFQRMWDALLAPGTGRLYLGERRGELLAGAIAFQLGPTTWYLYGASSSRNREFMASHAVQWAMIRWALEGSCTLYDFRGVSGDLRPENPLYGLYRFKRGFGAELVEYVGEFDRPCRPLGYWLLRRGVPLARRVLTVWRRRAGSPPGERS